MGSNIFYFAIQVCKRANENKYQIIIYFKKTFHLLTLLYFMLPVSLFSSFEFKEYSTKEKLAFLKTF